MRKLALLLLLLPAGLFGQINANYIQSNDSIEFRRFSNGDPFFKLSRLRGLVFPDGSTQGTAAGTSPDSSLVSSTNQIDLDLDTLRAENEHGEFKTTNVADSSGVNGQYIKGYKRAVTIVEVIKEHTLTVAKTGGVFSSVKGAVDSINNSTADSLNRWTILIYPGLYKELNPINLPNYTSIRSAGFIGTVGVEPLNAGALFVLDTLSIIDGLSILGGDLAFSMPSPGNNQISNCIINSTDTAFHVSNKFQLAYVNNIYLVAEGTPINEAFHVTAGNLTTVGINVVNNDPIKKMFHITGANSFATITGVNTFSANVDTVLFADDSARVIMNSCSIVSAKNGLVSNNSANVKYNGNSHFQISGMYTDNDLTGILAGYANNDDNDEALIIEGQELHVGDAAQGFEVCLGKGDSYSDDISVWTFDGSVYVDYSDSVKTMDGTGVEFPNVNVNTAIYIASTVNDTLKHDGIKVSITDSMTVGSGEVIMEYWNGSAWVEENGMVSESDAPYSPHAKQYFEQTVGTHIRYNIDLTNDGWRVSDDMSAGTDRKYVRFRIATAITESPRIDQIKLHTDRWEANEDGFTELFGNARNSQILPLNIGSGQPIEGNMQSQSIYVDENIGVGYTENNFTTTTDVLGFPLNFPDNIDTGCPLNIVFSGRSVNTGTMEWTIRWFVLKPDGTLYTTEPAASGDAGLSVVSVDVVSGGNTLIKVPIDISEAISTRKDGFGDQLWFTIQPTTLQGNFAITNIGAAYWTWAEGGHY